jgi:ABC-2 type transport system permease protein
VRVPNAINVVAAELDKLRTLPAAALAAVGTTVVGVALAAALTASAAAAHGAAVPTTDVPITDIMARAVPFVQTGLILLGVLPVSHELAGSQLRTTLAAVPRRGLLLVGKTVATLVVTALTAAATVGGLLGAATVTAYLTGAPVAPGGIDAEPVLGAVAYLVLVGLLSHAVTLLLRGLVPALVGTLGLVLIVSPLLATLTEHARWLPDRAAAQLYAPGDEVLTAATGALVTLAWIAAVGASAAVRFVRRDP